MLSGITKLAGEGDGEGFRRMLDAATWVEYMDNGQFSMTPLQVAAQGGHLEIVRLVLARGANFGHDDFSPVTSAALAGKWIMITQLTEHGGDFLKRDGHGKSGHDYLRRCRA